MCIRDRIEAGYNRRRSQCEAAVGALNVASLRDITIAELFEREPSLDAQLYQCALHVVTEDERTLGAADALARGALGELGGLMNESHASLRDVFGVSSRPLDAMVEACLLYTSDAAD